MNTSSGLQQLTEELLQAAKRGGPKQSIEMHGLACEITGQRLFMEADELAAYLRSGAAFMAELRPVGYREEQLAQKLVDSNWWLNRSAAIDNNLLNALRIDTSASSQRADSAQTDGTVAQSLAFRGECAGPNSFEVLARCGSRVSHLFFDVTRELERLQAARLTKGEDAFDLAKCEPHAWYLDQIRAIEEIAAEKAPLKRFGAA